ncbi:MAG: tyrosine-type recombinase/integrase [Bacteroidales bacterium]|nr:tyrosine-type recombinase/integrase [Bacteroidales bacterium]
MNIPYPNLQNNFKKWLNALGYAEGTVYTSTHYVRDFFTWLNKNKINELNQIKPQVITNYHQYLQKRPNKRQPGSLSNNYIISNINALKRFSKYLEQTQRVTIEININIQTEKSNTTTILTKAETQALYKACRNNYLGIRDRAMLSIFYGCGLRRSEGVALNLSDILLKEKRVFVRKGKNNKERYVPMAESVKDDLENYINVSREKTLSFKNIKQEALFLGISAKRLSGNGFLSRLQKIVYQANIIKPITLHTLRHSIATHLLQSGMKLEEVSNFLGHSSLESTQIYTHIANE